MENTILQNNGDSYLTLRSSNDLIEMRRSLKPYSIRESDPVIGYAKKTRSNIWHVFMYAGEGRFIHALGEEENWVNAAGVLWLQRHVADQEESYF